MDRNCYSDKDADWVRVSLSARRAWIEIIDYVVGYATDAVALRKESVDRNDTMQIIVVIVYASLSARRAWIEMDWASVISAMTSRRSPQGERG